MSVAEVRERVAQALDTLTETELREVAEYVSFLRFRAQRGPLPEVDPARLAALYAEFAEEDHALAEEGIKGYLDALDAEDAR
jgi:hypothetical protein